MGDVIGPLSAPLLAAVLVALSAGAVIWWRRREQAGVLDLPVAVDEHGDALAVGGDAGDRQLVASRS